MGVCMSNEDLLEEQRQQNRREHAGNMEKLAVGVSPNASPRKNKRTKTKAAQPDDKPKSLDTRDDY